MSISNLLIDGDAGLDKNVSCNSLTLKDIAGSQDAAATSLIDVETSLVRLEITNCQIAGNGSQSYSLQYSEDVSDKAFFIQYRGVSGGPASYPVYAKVDGVAGDTLTFSLHSTNVGGVPPASTLYVDILKF